MGENREGASGRTPRRRQTLLALAAVALLLGAGAGLWAWQSGNGDAPEGTRDDVPVAKGAKGEQQTPVDGWVTIRPAGRTDLCLTDGRDRRGAYGSAVAVHLPCAGARCRVRTSNRPAPGCTAFSGTTPSSARGV